MLIDKNLTAKIKQVKNWWQLTWNIYMVVPGNQKFLQRTELIFQFLNCIAIRFTGLDIHTILRDMW